MFPVTPRRDAVENGSWTGTGREAAFRRTGCPRGTPSSLAKDRRHLCASLRRCLRRSPGGHRAAASGRTEKRPPPAGHAEVVPAAALGWGGGRMGLSPPLCPIPNTDRAWEVTGLSPPLCPVPDRARLCVCMMCVRVCVTGLSPPLHPSRAEDAAAAGPPGSGSQVKPRRAGPPRRAQSRTQGATLLLCSL